MAEYYKINNRMSKSTSRGCSSGVSVNLMNDTPAGCESVGHELMTTLSGMVNDCFTLFYS